MRGAVAIACAAVVALFGFFYLSNTMEAQTCSRVAVETNPELLARYVDESAVLEDGYCDQCAIIARKRLFELAANGG